MANFVHFLEHPVGHVNAMHIMMTDTWRRLRSTTAISTYYYYYYTFTD